MIVTMMVLGVPPGVDADSVMTEVMMCVDGGTEDAATEMTTLADDGGGVDDGGGFDDGAGVETSEERETGVELGGGEEDVTTVAVPLLLAAMSNKTEQRSYKKERVRLGLDRSRLTVVMQLPDQNST